MKRDRYFDDFFLSLSQQLTLQIAQANSVLLEEDAALDREDLDEVDGEEDEMPDLRGTPPPNLRRREVMPDAHLETCWRTIRERLYRYLAFLARSPRFQREEPEPCPIFETLPSAMAHLLGVEGGRFMELPFMLTGEFRDWLAAEAGQRFYASWGVMRLLDESHLEVVAKEVLREESPRSTRDSFPAYRPRSIRNR